MEWGLTPSVASILLMASARSLWCCAWSPIVVVTPPSAPDFESVSSCLFVASVSSAAGYALAMGLVQREGQLAGDEGGRDARRDCLRAAAKRVGRDDVACR